MFIRGIRVALKLAKSEPIASMLIGDEEHPDLDHKLDQLTDKELEGFVRKRVETVYVFCFIVTGLVSMCLAILGSVQVPSSRDGNDGSSLEERCRGLRTQSPWDPQPSRH